MTAYFNPFTGQSVAVDVLELFAEAQGRGPEQVDRSLSQVLAGGFVLPHAGKSGLTRPQLTDDERKAKRAEIARRQHAANMADPQKAERVRELRRERVRRFRARQAAGEGSR